MVSNEVLSSSVSSEQCARHSIQPTDTIFSAICLQSLVFLLSLSALYGSPDRRPSCSSWICSSLILAKFLWILFYKILTISCNWQTPISPWIEMIIVTIIAVTWNKSLDPLMLSSLSSLFSVIYLTATTCAFCTVSDMNSRSQCLPTSTM